MNYSTAVFLINDSVRAVVATYEDGGKKNTFKTLDQTIKTDDICVVPSTTRHGMTTVKVVEVDVNIDFDSTETVPWIVQKVDKDGFENLTMMEKQAVDMIHSAEQRRKREELRKSILADQAESIKALPISSASE